VVIGEEVGQWANGTMGGRSVVEDIYIYLLLQIVYIYIYSVKVRQDRI
jgi:hypothetical protein